MQPKTVLFRENQELETLDYSGFRDRLVQHLASGQRVLSCFGSPHPDRPSGPPMLHAVVLGETGLALFIGQGRAGDVFPSLSTPYPQMHCFEREIHEQFSLPFSDHPWLKPIRFEGRNLGRMDDYPFYQLGGKEVHEVGVGPIHAGVIEPGHFRFMCYGERVHHLEIHLGYQHRGAESLLVKTMPSKLPPLVESVAGDTAVANVVAFCRAWEALCGVPLHSGVEAVRGVAVELERIAMHLVGVGGLATDVAFLPGSSTYGRLRTSIINLIMRLCGSRFGRSWFRPGELRYAFGAKQKTDIRDTLRLVQRDIAIINDLFLKSRSVRHRLELTPRASCFAVSFVEGCRGEVMHAIRTDDTGRIAHYKVQDPSLRNWFGLAQAVRDNAISDFPICNKSFDLSYCGNDL